MRNQKPIGEIIDVKLLRGLAMAYVGTNVLLNMYKCVSYMQSNQRSKTGLRKKTITGVH